jgi:hypothetical protein
VSVSDFLRRYVEAVERSGIPYMLTGSFASSYYGTPRGTQDLDLVISPTRAQLRQLLAPFGPPDYYVDVPAALAALQEEGQFNVLDLDSGGKVDFIIRKDNDFNDSEFRRRTQAVVNGVPVSIATAEDVIVAKLEWAQLGQSTRQIEDVAGILGARGDSLDLAYVERWIRELGLEKEWAAARARAGLSA